MAALLTLVLASTALAKKPATSSIYPTTAKPFGESYAAWSAHWWQWALAIPPDAGVHPFIDDAAFECDVDQSGPVWFLGAPLGAPAERTCAIPADTAVFVGLLNAECSDLEGLGTTEAGQRDCANFFANHIVDLFATLDGKEVAGLTSFRFVSSQFTFTAPEPWIFSPAPGGTGTAVSDGYFLMLKPLSAGTHTLHFGGAFHFSVAEGDPFDFDAELDMTYELTVED